jgi:hypothetical protein
MSTLKFMLLAGAMAMTPIGAQAMSEPAPDAEIVAHDGDSEATAAAMVAELKAKQQREMDEIVAMIEKIFDTSALPAIEPARLTLAETTTTALVPPGSLERMIDNLYGKVFATFMKEFSGPSDTMIAIKTGLESDQITALDEKSKQAIADLFDPHRKEREDQVTKVMKPLISEALVDIERPMQGGMAKAYARKFSADQLTELNAFFATPTGRAYAHDWMAMQADPEVMLAVVRAMPSMVNKFIDRAPQIEADMRNLPKERALADLSEAELKTLAKLTKVSVKVLKENRDMWDSPVEIDAAPPMTESYADDAAEAAVAAADAAAESADWDPAYDRSTWSDADRQRVEELESASEAASSAAFEAEQAAVANARKKKPAD